MTFSIFSSRFCYAFQDKRIIGEGGCTASSWYGEPWAFCLFDQGPVSRYSAHGACLRASVFALTDSSAGNRNAPPMTDRKGAQSKCQLGYLGITLDVNSSQVTKLRQIYVKW